MSSSRTINEGDNLIDNCGVRDFLNPELCEDAGIIVMGITENTLNLGAMNLSYIKVKKVINTIEDKFNLKVSLKQITSLEWETWFENTHAISVQTIQKKSNLTPQDNIIQLQEEINVDLENDFQDLETEITDEIDFENDINEEDDEELIDDANDEALIRLAQANI